MKSPLLVPVLLLVGGLALLLPAERFTRSARTSSGSYRSETPWVRYVMVGMGGFRGVVSEILWIRADRLQQQGRYMELVQLSDWITALDPRATEGWAINAWNLAYNITAMLPDHESRLPWVRAGISLLRDKALQANPGDPQLYKELGWLYQNKIGASDDPAHVVYKLDLASEFREDGTRARPSGTGHDELDPGLVREIEERFGEIDWRLANAHGLYWACKGLKLHPTGFDEESLRRMVQQTLLSLVSAGRFTGDPSSGVYRTAPAFGLIPGLERFFEESIRRGKADEKIYAVFLARIICLLEQNGRTEEARGTYGKLARVTGKTGIPLPPYEVVASGTPLDLKGD